MFINFVENVHKFYVFINFVENIHKFYVLMSFINCVESVHKYFFRIIFQRSYSFSTVRKIGQITQAGHGEGRAPECDMKPGGGEG